MPAAEAELTEPGALEVTQPTIRFGLVLLLLTAIYLCASITDADWMTPVLLVLAATLVIVLAMPTRPSRSAAMRFAMVFVGATVLSVLLTQTSRRGSGFSDLMVAAMLRQAGHEVVVFDKAEEAAEALLLETKYKALCDHLAEVQGQLKGAPPEFKAELESEVAELQEKKEKLEEAIAEEKAALEER